MTENLEKETRQIEKYLGVRFSPTYRRFLLEHGSDVVGGRRIFGLPLSMESNKSVLGATLFLRTIRPDLPLTYIAIILDNDWGVCFDAAAEEDDPELIDIDLKEGGYHEKTGATFTEYINYFEKRHTSYQVAYCQLKNRKREFERALPGTLRKIKRLDPTEKEKQEFRREADGKNIQYTLEPRSQDWHPRIFRMMDMVVIIYCFRYNYSYGCLEVDVFWAPEDKRCGSDEMIKWAAMAIFAEAINIGGSMNIIFTRDSREQEDGSIPEHFVKEKPRRVSAPVPSDLVAYAKSKGVAFARAQEGRISYQEALELWWKSLGLSEKAKMVVEELEKAGWLPREWLCYIVTQNNWSPEEADWILQNAPRPEAVLLATDPPEHRLPFAETLAWGRAALITSRFIRKVVLGFTGGYAPEEDIPVSNYTLKTEGPFQILCFEESWKLPWLHPKHQEELAVPAGEPVLIHCRPRYPLRLGWDKKWLDKELKIVAEHSGNFVYRLIILAMEFEESPLIEFFIWEAKKKGVTVLFGQRALELYEDDLMERFHRIRVQRRLPSRILPMRLMALEAPDHLWTDKKIGLDIMSRTAETFGRWIGKQIKVKRARFDFVTHNWAVERIITECQEAREIGELSAEQSELVQIALFPSDEHYPDISFSYVKPERMKEFFAKLPPELQKKFKVKEGSGLVFVYLSHEKVSEKIFPSSIKPREARQGDILTGEFPLAPVDPSKLAISWWKKDIQTFQERLEESLRTGNPLPVSFLRMSLFADMLCPYLWHEVIEKKETEEKQVDKYPYFNWLFRLLGKKPPVKLVREIKTFREHKPPRPVNLRIVYQDGSEGERFPFFDLPPIEKPKDLFKLNLGTVSMRHQTTDFAVAGYIMINLEVQFRRDSGASEQEAFAFHRTLIFVGNLLKAARGQDLEIIKKLDPVYNLLIWHYKLGAMPARGLELHLFQATGLEPITVGVWRGLRELIKRNRGELLVVPRVLVGSSVGLDPALEGEERRRAVEETYKMGQPWY